MDPRVLIAVATGAQTGSAGSSMGPLHQWAARGVRRGDRRQPGRRHHLGDARRASLVGDCGIGQPRARGL